MGCNVSSASVSWFLRHSSKGKRKPSLVVICPPRPPFSRLAQRRGVESAFVARHCGNGTVLHSTDTEHHRPGQEPPSRLLAFVYLLYNCTNLHRLMRSARATYASRPPGKPFLISPGDGYFAHILKLEHIPTRFSKQQDRKPESSKREPN